MRWSAPAASGSSAGLVLFELGHELTLFDVDRTRVAQLRAGEMPFFEPEAATVLRSATRERSMDGDRSRRRDCRQRRGADRRSDAGWTRWTVRARCARGSGIAVVPGPRRCAGPAALARHLSSQHRSPGHDRKGPHGRSHRCRPTARRRARSVTCRSSCARARRSPMRGSQIASSWGRRTPDLHSLAHELFDGLDTTFFETGIRTAELIKTTNNALLSICISFANEIARIAETIEGADAIDVFEGDSSGSPIRRCDQGGYRRLLFARTGVWWQLSRQGSQRSGCLCERAG